MLPNSILIVDDDDMFRKSVVSIIKGTKEINLMPYEAKVCEEALEMLINNNNKIGCILLDYNFERWGGPDTMNGLEFAEKLKDIAPHIPIIMTSNVGDRADIAMKAAHKYVHDFLDKPFSKEQFINKLKLIFKESVQGGFLDASLKARNILTQNGFICNSTSMMRTCYDAMVASTNDWNILIIGETGTGKTRLAEIIHKLSSRKNTTFIQKNCGELTPNLAGSELFGHIRGAFTGADKDKIGLFESAGSGTLLLDEITEIPVEYQSKLLYTLGEQKMFYRVGDSKNPKYNKARIIAATSIEPSDAVAKNILREDLLARFQKIIRIPPIRDRIDDIPQIINKILEDISLKSGKDYHIDEFALNLILRQLWLKNVRQIKNFINRCISRIDWENFDIITVNIVIEELALEYGIEKQNTGKSLSELLDNLVNYLLDNREKLFDNSVKGENFGGLKYLNSLFEKKLLLETLNRTDGNILAASRYLYENKDTLRNHIKNLDLT